MSEDIVGFEAPTDDVLLGQAEVVLAVAADALADIVKQVKSGDVAATEKVVPAAVSYRTAFERVMSERDKIGKLRNEIVGAVGRRTLDLDAARVEIGRRLACLRHTGAG